MTIVNIYLTFNGNCEDAFNFYKEVFGGELKDLSRFNEIPKEDENYQDLSEEEGNKLMHVSLPISKETVLMGSDAGGEWAPHIKPGNNFSISINTDSKEKADVFFNKLSQGGVVTMPMDNTFWGSYFGMCTDQFGINWMVSVESIK